jgi:hypothetical protein
MPSATTDLRSAAQLDDGAHHRGVVVGRARCSWCTKLRSIFRLSMGSVEVAQRRVAGAEVVHRQPTPSARSWFSAASAPVDARHQDVLGELQRQVLRLAGPT